MVYNRDEFGETLAPRGTLATKKSGFWVSKLQIFGAEGGENFEILAVCKEKLALFCTFGGEIWPNCYRYSDFGLIQGKKQCYFFDSEKFGKVLQIPKKNLVSKVQISKISENSFLKMQ